MRIRSVHSRRTEPIQRPAKAFIRGGLRCREHDLDADGGEDRVEGGTELRVPVAYQGSESVPGLLQITGKTAGQLNHPVPGRMLGNAERVDPACLDLDDERDIQPLQRDGVDVEEVDRKQAAGLGAKEGAPGVVAARGWRDPAGTQDFADGRSGYPRWPRRRSSPWKRTTPGRGTCLLAGAGEKNGVSAAGGVRPPSPRVCAGCGIPPQTGERGMTELVRTAVLGSLGTTIRSHDLVTAAMRA
jgi:hypothetical protein